MTSGGAAGVGRAAARASHLSVPTFGERDEVAAGLAGWIDERARRRGAELEAVTDVELGFSLAEA